MSDNAESYSLCANRDRLSEMAAQVLPLLTCRLFGLNCRRSSSGVDLHCSMKGTNDSGMLKIAGVSTRIFIFKVPTLYWRATGRVVRVRPGAGDSTDHWSCATTHYHWCRRICDRLTG